MKAEVLHFNPDVSSLGRARNSFVETLRGQHKTVALIEGCTGGALSDAITIPGASKIISGGITPYSREAKIKLGLPVELLDTYGEYSPQVATAMAKLSQKKQGTDLGIGVVGNLDNNGTVFASYILGPNSIYEQAFTPATTDRRQKNNEITVRVLTTANELLHGQVPRFDIPLIGEHVNLYGEEQDFVAWQAEEIIGRCRDLGLTLGTMESCSGLALADKLTNVQGSQDVFQVGFLAYDENVKQQLGVPFELMARGGVYSKEVAASMAENVLDKMGTDIGFAATGVLDVWDMRPYHEDVPPGVVSLAIAQRGRETWCTTAQFDVETRDKMKLNVVKTLFGKFLELSAQGWSFTNQYLPRELAKV